MRKLLLLAGGDLAIAQGPFSESAVWVNGLLKRGPARVVTVAMASKTARIAWAVPRRSDVYRPPDMVQ